MMIPILSINVLCACNILINGRLTSLLSSGACLGEELIMLIEHGEICSTSGGLLFDIRASRGHLDGGGNLGNRLPLRKSL